MTEDDRVIVEAIRAGDPGAFRDLYQRHFRRIHSFSLRRLGDVAEAEDVCQDVFEAVYSCLDRFEGKSDLIVWIYGITRNILNNRLREQYQRRMTVLRYKAALSDADELAVTYYLALQDRVAEALDYAGHDLNYHNVQPIAAIPGIRELNIGHAIVAHALFVGFPEAVREMKSLMREAAQGREAGT